IAVHRRHLRPIPTRRSPIYNVNGAIAARAVVSQRVNEGMCMMYHAQEKIVNTPGAETTGTRGGIHNSVTRTVLKPTHMIGGYAQDRKSTRLNSSHVKISYAV